MEIKHLKINHLVNPLGYDIADPTISYVCENTTGSFQKSARVIVAHDMEFKDVIYDSGDRSDICSTAFELPIKTEPCTRYYWKVRAVADDGDFAESDTAWFETPKESEWNAKWITPVADKKLQVCIFGKIDITKPIRRARVYMVGLGLYELYINKHKQGNECLLPGFCPYDSYIPYQTFDSGDSLCEGENLIEVVLGDGWYKGWYGLHKKAENYGDRLALIGEIYLWYEDGSFEKVCMDDSWKARRSRVVYSGIYPGEIFDCSLDCSDKFDVEELPYELQAKMPVPVPRTNPQIKIHERITPVKVINTPAGEQVLDMGQNMVGWLQFHCNKPAGSRIVCYFGEILQDGNFYNANLRTAKAEFTYISDGKERDVRQHFTFYGYRYVKITGWDGEMDVNGFQGLVIHSDMEEIGTVTTSDPLVNQLISNAKWGMKGNFLDIPTDCPQRDERYGWTGDAQIFSGTACYFMDTYAFYSKYGKDIFCEQKHYDGAVPDTVPVCNNDATISTAWGEAGTIIPWNVYVHSGDAGILRHQYKSMREWVDYIKREDDKHGARNLYQSGFHYGDWLALDGNIPGGVYGATDPFLISSAYYFYSTNIVAKAAKVLAQSTAAHEADAGQYKADALYYSELASKIRQAFIREYFSESGRLCENTMTAYVVVLFMGLVPDYAMEQTRKGLMEQLVKARYHLKTGFVGTPYLCRTLSDNGMNGLAYHLLLEKGYPGWLYEVLMGATTIWERWDSILPDGRISGTEMNSMNHYSYGSIVEWMFRDMTGIKPDEEKAGFKHFIIAPHPDYRMRYSNASLRSASGMIRSGWKIDNDKESLTVDVEVPFDTTAELILPDAEMKEIKYSARQKGNAVIIELTSGKYSITYHPTTKYRKTYSLDTPFEELKSNPVTKKILDEEFYSKHTNIPFEKELFTLREVINGPFDRLSYEDQAILDKRLREV